MWHYLSQQVTNYIGMQTSSGYTSCWFALLPRNQELPNYFHNDGYVCGEETAWTCRVYGAEKVSLHVYHSAPCTVWLLFLLMAPCSLHKTWIIKVAHWHPDHQPKCPLSSSCFSHFGLSYQQPSDLVAALPRTKKSEENCIMNTMRGTSVRPNVDYLYWAKWRCIPAVHPCVVQK